MSLDTRGFDPQRLLPKSLEEQLLSGLGRTSGAVLFASVLAVWASLMSWSITDPSLTHATTANAQNWLGPIGAIVSDLLLQTLGIAAAIALIAPFAWSVDLVRASRIDGGRLKCGYFPLSILAVAGAVSALPVTASWPLHHGLGGVLGDGLLRAIESIVAVVSADRAGLVSGLILTLLTVLTIAKSVGLDAEDAKAVLEDLKHHNFRDYASKLDLRRRVAWLKQLGSRASNDSVADGLTYPLHRSEPSLSMRLRDLADGHMPRFEPARAAPPVRPAPIKPVVSTFEPIDTDTDDLEDIESTFDACTDAESQAIAARFAPGAAGFKPDIAVREPAPAPAKKAAPAPAAKLVARSDASWRRPSLNLLKRPLAAKPGPELTQTVMRGNARLLEDVLADFGVKGEVKAINPGPVVTLYELEPARGTKSSRVIGLADDIARSMSLASVRAAVVPGRNAIGLELPNVRREPVMLREILEADAYKSNAATLPLALGKTIAGDPIVVDLARMPHLLIAGTTGSGKSVGVNAMVLSLLYRHDPQDCRLLMIDPKMLELSVYNGIPHLLTPVVTDPQKAVAALNWAVCEMEERYKRMASLNVRNIDVFNNRVRNSKKRGEMLSRTVQTGFDRSGQAVFEKQKIELEPLPHIVVVVDEFADLMMVAGKEVETAVQRLAQMARAAGIHLIMATQRPSVDVLTGTIKANFPTRISFKVTSKIDSRTILNEQGAEQLLGHGDMLYSTGAGQITRVHGAFVADEEVEAIAAWLREQGTPKYVEGILDTPQGSDTANGARDLSEGDLYDRAVAIVLRDRKATTSYLQRRLSIGYNRAADLIERMEREGLITAASSVGKREILASVSGADAA